MGLAAFTDRADRHLELMRATFDRFDIDLADVARRGAGSRLRGAMWTCIGCTKTAACAAWLRDGAASGERRGFCPNADLIEDLRP
jgi:Family of unknown function (DUF6455)